MGEVKETRQYAYDGLSLDDVLIVATIDQRFRALTDTGCDPVHALMLAVRVDVMLRLPAAATANHKAASAADGVGVQHS